MKLPTVILSAHITNNVGRKGVPTFGAFGALTLSEPHEFHFLSCTVPGNFIILMLKLFPHLDRCLRRCLRAEPGPLYSLDLPKLLLNR